MMIEVDKSRSCFMINGHLLITTNLNDKQIQLMCRSDENMLCVE